MVTIHQPSTRVLRRFSSILLLSSGGQQLYFGPAHAAGYGVARIERIMVGGVLLLNRTHTLKQFTSALLVIDVKQTKQHCRNHPVCAHHVYASRCVCRCRHSRCLRRTMVVVILADRTVVAVVVDMQPL